MLGKTMECVYQKEDQCLYYPKKNKCEKCPAYLDFSDIDFLKKWKDPLRIVTRNREPTESLRNLLAGGGAFLIGGGPSANDLPLESLSERGMFSLAINNAAGHPRIKPQAFVCSDPPQKFSSSIWFDPGIMKFAPSIKLSGRRGRIRIKDSHGKFTRHEKRITDCPNVWGFQRHAHLFPDIRYILSDGAMWGNHDAGVRKTDEPKTVCTMLLGLRLLIYLGAKTIYLVGVDFRMGKGYGYSFNQGRTDGAVNSNNSQFAVVNDWLCQMQQNGTFSQFGIKVFNCFERSGLRAFPYAPFEAAVEDVRGEVEKVLDLQSWYDK